MSRALSTLIVFVLVVGLIVLATFAEQLFEDTRVRQAFVAGCFLAAGWFATAAIREIGNLVDRFQRSIDIQKALKGEIEDYAEALKDDDPTATADAICKKVLDGGDNAATAYHPFVPRVSSPIVFAEFVREVPLLPGPVIDDVVQFYSVLSDVITMSEDLGSDAFTTRTASQREGVLRDYLSIRKAAHELAVKSFEKLDRSIDKDQARTLGHIMGTKPMSSKLS